MIGQSLARYRITAAIGAGGMGEVYRATDSTLGRDVAIKVLPAEVARDPDRLARFEREARLLASLNHPSIAHVYGFESATLPDGSAAHFLAMELVEGEDLAERLKRGRVAAEEALAIAKQIAEALEEAHERGIVHRDLKPANVKVTPDGKVKVLDFGLAKAYAGEAAIGSGPDLSQSPTLAHTGTQAGIILGTAGYMSPEQARGKPVDKRADIWAFGVVLYEMLTGRQLFAGETVSDTLAAVLRAEVAWSALPAETPTHVRRLLARCLERDPKQRLRDVGEARVALDALGPGDAGAPSANGRRGVSLPIFAAALAGAVAIAALVAGGWAIPSSASRASSEVTEFSIGVDGLVAVALSPDGRRLGWTTRTSADLGDAPWTERGKGDTFRRLFVRDLDNRLAREVASDADLRTSFWSPDGSQLAAQVGDRLYRIPVAGGERTPICDLPTIAGVSGRGVLAGVWLPDDTLLFAAWRGGLYRVAARGGDPELYVPIDPKVDVDFHQILLLPDGSSLILAVHRQQDPSDAKAPTARLELVRDGRREALLGSEELGDVAPVGYADGTLVLANAESSETAAWGVPFDAKRGIVTGKKVVLVPRVSSASVGSDGTLAYVPPRARPSVVARVDRAGAEIARLGVPHPHLDRQALSPDGSRLAVVLDARELWVRDLGRGTLTRLATEEKEFIEDPQWTPDGRTIYFAAGNSSIFRRIRADPGATPETVFDDAYRAFLAPDGSGLLLRKGGFRLSADQGFYWAPLDSQGRPGERKKLLGGLDSLGRLAPGGRLLAYGEGLIGKREAFLTTFPAVDQTIQLSANGGGTPQWSRDGRSVYYLAGGALVEVRVGLDAAGRLTASPEGKLFELDKAGLRPEGWNPAPDGNGFLFLKSLATDNRAEIVVVRNGLQRAKASTR